MNKENEKRLKTMTCHLPVELIDTMDELVAKKVFLNRSEIVRSAVIKTIPEFISTCDNTIINLDHSKPSRGNSKMISFKLSTGLLDLLDHMCEHIGLSRSELLRHMVIFFFCNYFLKYYNKQSST